MLSLQRHLLGGREARPADHGRFGACDVARVAPTRWLGRAGHHWVTAGHCLGEPQLKVSILAVLSEEADEVEVAISVELFELQQLSHCLTRGFLLLVGRSLRVFG